LALAVPLSRVTSRVGGGSAFFVRHHHTPHIMKRYFVAKSPNGKFVGSFTFQEIVAQRRAGEIRDDYVVTESTGPTFAELSKQPDVQWEPVSTFITRSPSEEPTVSPVVEAEHRFSSVGSRYSDAYLVAKTTSAIGIVVKTVGIILGVLVAIVGVVIGAQHEGAPQMVLGGVLLGFVVALPLWVLGVLVCAQAQVLKATLDTAVHSSPFLNKDEMARVMSL